MPFIGIAGPSGSGKTTSLRNLDPNESLYISHTKLDLPFPSAEWSLYDKKSNPKGNLVPVENIQEVNKWLQAAHNSKRIKTVIVDDITHMFTREVLDNDFRSMGKTKESYSRWETVAWKAFEGLLKNMYMYRPDLFVVLVFHTAEVYTDHGVKLVFKTPGKMLDTSIDIMSYFNYILFTKVYPVDPDEPKPAHERYRFVTNDDGYRSAKTPMGLYSELEINNDLVEVEKAILDFRQRNVKPALETQQS